MSAELTKPQATLIAELVHALRPDWHVTGTMSALLQVKDRDPFLVALAAIRAANRAANLTPAVIPLPGLHWLTETTPPKPANWTPADNPLCTRCGKVHDPDATECPRRNPHAYTQGAALARAAIHGAKTKSAIEQEEGRE